MSSWTGACEKRWVVGVSRALTSCWDFLCGPASPETPASRREHQHHQRRRFGDGGIRTGTGAAAGRLAEVGRHVLYPAACRRSCAT